MTSETTICRNFPSLTTERGHFYTDERQGGSAVSCCVPVLWRFASSSFRVRHPRFVWGWGFCIGSVWATVSHVHLFFLNEW